jgi:hypothetical protein
MRKPFIEFVLKSSIFKTNSSGSLDHACVFSYFYKNLKILFGKTCENFLLGHAAKISSHILDRPQRFTVEIKF